MGMSKKFAALDIYLTKFDLSTYGRIHPEGNINARIMVAECYVIPNVRRLFRALGSGNQTPDFFAMRNIIKKEIFENE